ncbi:MAG: DUF1292 domain-containing protein [Bacillota bacterium]|nr:DUF1292 domain-containing protein [Bacillota bacterium]
MDNEKINGCGCGDDCGCGENEHNHEHGDACGCGCGEHETLIVDLEDENGNTIACEVVDGFIYNDTEYALVQNPDNQEVYIFKVVGEGDEGELVVPDDEEYEAATKYYESLLETQE